MRTADVGEQGRAPKTALPDAAERDAPAPPRSLQQDATTGFRWLIGQSAVSRLATFAAQVVLAWILSPDAFGTIGLAYAVLAFVTVLQEGGVGQVLVAEQRRFGALSLSAFWLSVLFGAGTALLVAAAAPLVGAAYDSEVLPKLLWVLAAAIPFQAMRSVPAAVLSVDLRFGTRTKLSVLELVAQQALTVAFALLGFGVYSFVVPVLLVAPVATALYFWRSGYRPSGFDLGASKELLRPSSQLISAQMVAKAVEYGDYLVLGYFYDKATVGIYFLAYSLSVQGVMLIVSTMGGTLFPILSKLRDDPERQTSAFLRVNRIGTIAMVPFCVFVGLHAGSVIGLLYAPKWAASAPLLMVLSVGMALRISSAAGYSALMARGEYHLILYKNLARTALLLVLLIPAARHSILAAAGAVAAVYLLEAMAVFLLVVRKEKGAPLLLAGVVLPPLSIAAIAGLLSMAPALVVGRSVGALLLALGSGLLIFVGAYGLLLRFVFPARAREFFSLLAGLLGRPSIRATPTVVS